MKMTSDLAMKKTPTHPLQALPGCSGTPRGSTVDSLAASSVSFEPCPTPRPIIDALGVREFRTSSRSIATVLASVHLNQARYGLYLVQRVLQIGNERVLRPRGVGDTGRAADEGQRRADDRRRGRRSEERPSVARLGFQCAAVAAAAPSRGRRGEGVNAATPREGENEERYPIKHDSFRGLCYDSLSHAISTMRCPSSFSRPPPMTRRE